MIPLLLAILAQCGPHVPDLPWFEYCTRRQSPRVASWPVMHRDCLYGPGQYTPPGCRARFDFDDDGDVDLADYAILQREGFDGPSPLPI